MDKNMKLTPHFTLGEMCVSKSHPEAQNEPSQEVVDNLTEVCWWLEVLRTVYNQRYSDELDGREHPFIINSGYRSRMLNRAVGGEQDSRHLTGNAADINCPGKDGRERCKMAIRYAAILIEIFEARKQKWDEILIERKGQSYWVHFAVFPQVSGKNRCKISCLQL